MKSIYETEGELDSIYNNGVFIKMRVCLVLFFIFLLSGCNDKKYTINELIINESILHSIQKKCTSSISLRDSSNCINALTATETLQQAESGDAQKQRFLAELYISNNEYSKAIQWLSAAAGNGDEQAVDKLGQLAYVIGSRKPATPKDQKMLRSLEELIKKYQQPDSVLSYYLKNLSEGDASALISLGLMYRRGEGVDKNFDTAISYFNRYSQNIDVKSPGWGDYYLAYMHLNGEGFNKSEFDGIQLFDKSCLVGFTLSCLKLADLYFHGGTYFNPDYKKATKLLDVIYNGEKIDSRNIEHVDDLLTMYAKGGYGIERNPTRIKEINDFLCEKKYRYCAEK
ncbi:EexN family lipoprotein [Enterobacter sp. CFBP8995]|nr:EexN family lipoprotein [Enterobacter sp. CFBP8995]